MPRQILQPAPTPAPPRLGVPAPRRAPAPQPGFNPLSVPQNQLAMPAGTRGGGGAPAPPPTANPAFPRGSGGGGPHTPAPYLTPDTARLHPGDPGYHPEDAASNRAPPEGFPDWRSWNLERQRQQDAESKSLYDKWIAEGNTLPPGAVPIGDPRLKAGGGPHGWSNEYYHPSINGNPAPYWLPIESADAQPAGWRGGHLTKQGADNPYAMETQYSGHAQYDPRLFDLWRQQHPNDPRQYAGPAGLPPELAQKWYAAQGHKMWQQAVVNQANQPNNGQGPTPAGGLSRTTPGIPAADSPYWSQQGKKWYEQQGAPFLPGGARGPAKPPAPPPRKAAVSPISTAQQGTLKTTLAGKKGATPGTKFTQDGRTYTMNPKGAWVDTTDPNARVRVTDRGGGFLGDTDRAKNVQDRNAAAYLKQKKAAADTKAANQKKAKDYADAQKKKKKK